MSEWCRIIQCELSHWSSFSRVYATSSSLAHCTPELRHISRSFAVFVVAAQEPTSGLLAPPCCKFLLYLKVSYVRYQKEATSTEYVWTLMLIFTLSRPIKMPWETGIVEAFMPDHSRYNDIFITYSASPLTPSGTYHSYQKNRSSTRRLESDMLGISSSRRFTRMFDPCPFGIKTTFQPQ